ncbi:MAG: PIN domain-containing protein [Pyrinomonadaceae bacterium]|nr:PIN domain-containing protein [Pyrinomonadaceae bacterium]MBP6214148.1 PIN domain-containing protein [Pyrinomonadaceae bacterium]
MDFVVDTHALFWYLTDDSRLGSEASSVFEQAESGSAFIHIPSIVIAELYFIVRKFNAAIDFGPQFVILESASQFILTPFDAEDVLDFDRDSVINEMHDRIIVGVARRLDAPLLTRDRNIVESNLVKVVW